jgi:tetratricopeptide (TPR) repeat protein
VSGPSGSEAIETDARPTRDEALTESAERLYARLHPVGGAYYYFSRDPARGLESLQRALDAERDRPSMAVYRAWGLALRNLGDFEGAREMFDAAMSLAGTGAERAHLFVEMGYAAGAAGDWEGAVRDFERASGEDAAWPVPLVRQADAFRGRGDDDAALAAYERAIRLRGPSGDAWAGIGRVHAVEGRPELALDAYRAGQRIALDPRSRAALLRDVGDVLFALGCADQAARRYADAIALDGRYDAGRAAAWGRACPRGSVPPHGEAPGCAAFEAPSRHG